MAPRIRPRDINYQNLRDLYRTYSEHEGGEQRFCDMLTEEIRDPQSGITARSFSLRDLAEVLLPNWEDYDPRRSNLVQVAPALRMDEAAVTTTAFGNVTGQIIYDEIMGGWDEADNGLGEQLVTIVPTRYEFEKIPGATELEDDGDEVGEGEEYPETGFSEHYRETPLTTKRGRMVSITKELIYYDRTGLVLDRARSVGERLGRVRLKNILRVVLGITNNYKFDGSSSDTYATSGARQNVVALNTLTDWKAIEAVMLQKSLMTHPDTGDPMPAMIDDMLVPPALFMTARNILNATEVRTGDGASSTVQTVSNNPTSGMVQRLLVSSLIRSLLVDEGGLTGAEADGTFFAGRFRRAFEYRENWPITVATLGADAEQSIRKDIVASWRSSEKGVAAVKEPREVMKSQAHT